MPAGRLKGQEGGTRREARALLRDKFPDWHPIVQMAELANDDEQATELRFQAAKEVNAYLMPKLKAVEVTGNDGGAINILLQTPGDGTL